ncbi:PDZ domain-containing protein [Myxococcota bacterium]
MRVWLCIAGLASMCACGPSAEDKLASLPIRAETRSALERLRFMQLRNGDRLERGDVVLCGPRDRAALGFSKRLVVDYLGRDSGWLIPDLFAVKADEVTLAVPPEQLLRLELPRGIGTSGRHPEAWVREVAGYPLYSSDLRAIDQLFASDGVEELFALREPPPDQQAEVTGGAPAARKPSWTLGVSPYPRMGPRNGVVIAEVIAKSPAEKAGLLKGDRIVKVDDQAVGTFRQLKRAIRGAERPRLDLEVVRKSTRAAETVSVDLSEVN